jgi:hypothetical protein
MIRASIVLERKMDCRVKPGNDDQKRFRQKIKAL